MHNKRFFRTVVLKCRQCSVFSLYNSVFRHLNYCRHMTAVYIFSLVAQRSVLFLGPHGGGALFLSPRVQKIDRLLPATKYFDPVIYYPILFNLKYFTNILWPNINKLIIQSIFKPIFVFCINYVETDKLNRVEENYG